MTTNAGLIGQLQTPTGEGGDTPPATPSPSDTPSAEATPATPSPTPSPEPVPAPAPSPEPQGEGDPNVKWLSEVTGGRLTDQDSLLATLENSVPKTEYEKLVEERDTFKNASENAYANEFTKGLNKLVQEGASKDQLSAYWKINNLGELTELNDRDAIVNKLMFEENLSESDARFKVNRSYPESVEDVFNKNRNLDPNSEEDVAEAENLLRLSTIQLQQDSKNSKEFLTKFKSDISLSTAQAEKQQLQQRTAVLQNSWNQVAHEAIKGLDKISLSMDEEGKEYSIDIPIPKEYLDEMVGVIPQFAATNGFEVNQQNMARVIESAKQNYIVQNYQKIFTTVMKDADSKGYERRVNETTNPGGVPTPGASGGGGAAPAGDAFTGVMSLQGRGRRR